MRDSHTYMIVSKRSDGVTNTVYVGPEVFDALRQFGPVSEDTVDGGSVLYVLTLSEYSLKLAYNEE